ncbi:hypothetical protein D1872_276920 [compost metagenome]
MPSQEVKLRYMLPKVGTITNKVYRMNDGRMNNTAYVCSFFFFGRRVASAALLSLGEAGAPIPNTPFLNRGGSSSRCVALHLYISFAEYRFGLHFM